MSFLLLKCLLSSVLSSSMTSWLDSPDVDQRMSMLLLFDSFFQTAIESLVNHRLHSEGNSFLSHTISPGSHFPVVYVKKFSFSDLTVSDWMCAVERKQCSRMFRLHSSLLSASFAFPSWRSGQIHYPCHCQICPSMCGLQPDMSLSSSSPICLRLQLWAQVACSHPVGNVFSKSLSATGTAVTHKVLLAIGHVVPDCRADTWGCTIQQGCVPTSSPLKTLLHWQTMLQHSTRHLSAHVFSACVMRSTADIHPSTSIFELEWLLLL